MSNPYQNPYPQQPMNPQTNPNMQQNQLQNPQYNPYSQTNPQGQYGMQNNAYPQNMNQPYAQQNNIPNTTPYGMAPNPYVQQPYGNQGTNNMNQGYANPYGNQMGQNVNPYGKQPQTNNMYVPPPQTNANVMKTAIMSYADGLFMKYDQNRSGYLDVKEIYNPVCEMFQMTGTVPPSYPQVLMIMQGFDTDRNGLLDINEFRRLLFLLNGIPA